MRTPWLVLTLLLAGCASSTTQTDPEPQQPAAATTADAQNPTPGWPASMPEFDPDNPHTWPLPMLWYETPIPDYDSPGNGYLTSDITLAGRRFVGLATFVGNGPGLEHVFAGTEFEGAPGATTFTIYALVPDEADVVTPGAAISRNHPTYTVAGRIATSDRRDDFLTILHHDRPDIAIVNIKLFDLAGGRVVLILPHEDGTVRYLQYPIGLLELGDIRDSAAFGAMIAPMLDTPELRALLEEPGVIAL